MTALARNSGKSSAASSPAYTWGYVGFVLIGLFILAGPITLACIATGAKIRRLDLPGSAYTRACAVAAVPALAIILVALGAANRMLDASLAMLILLASVPVAFLVLRFAFGFDWLTAGVAFAFAAVFGGVAVFATNKLSQKAAEAAFLRKEDTQRAMAQANAARQGSSPAPNVSRDAAHVRLADPARQHAAGDVALRGAVRAEGERRRGGRASSTCACSARR